MRNDRALLARRMRGGPMFEKEGTQRIIMVFTSRGFITLLVVSALDHRFGWSAVPVWAVVPGDVLVVIGFYLIFLVYRENTFAAATVEVATGRGESRLIILSHPTGALAPNRERAQRLSSTGDVHRPAPAERSINLKAAVEGERTQATVLFAELEGSMELLADRDPKEARKGAGAGAWPGRRA
jgi:hypothetical protein